MASRFDPRLNSMVKLSINEKSGKRGDEYPVKTYTVGPNIPEGTFLSKSRGEGKAGSPAHTKLTGHEDNRPVTPRPSYLDYKGRWVHGALPDAPVPHLTQPLSATRHSVDMTIHTLKQGDRKQAKTFRPVAAIHSYTDTSPVITSEFVNQQQERDDVQAPKTPTGTGTATKRPTGGRGSSSSSSRPGTSAGVPGPAMVPTPFASLRDTRSSVQLFWKHEPLHFDGPRVTDEDLLRLSDRQEDLGKNAVPGSAQSKLIGGRWRHAPRPVNGDVVFTDYYGPLAGGYKQSDYYGRSYTLSTQQLDKNRLVEDPAYVRVQANMSGIHALRNRPGYTMEGRIIHSSDPGQLLRVVATGSQSRTAEGLHSIKTYHRIQ